MSKQTEILDGAENVFEANGFRGIGVDHILAQSGASTRTLYKHFGSRDGLVAEVLSRRHSAFMEKLVDTIPSDPVGQVFDVQLQWIEEHTNSGCLFFRAFGEYSTTAPEITAITQEHKDAFEAEINRRVELALGRPDGALAMQVWILFEGAVALACMRGTQVIATARQSSISLIEASRDRAS